MDLVPFYGMVVACNDNDDLRRLLPGVQRRILTYGTHDQSDFLISKCIAAAQRFCGAEQLSRQLSRNYAGRISSACFCA